MESDIFNHIKGFFWLLVGDSPLLIISLTGIGVSIFKYSKNSRISILSIIAWVILLGTVILWPAAAELNFYLSSVVYHYSMATLGLISFSISLVRSIFLSISFVLFFIAIWKDRN